MLVFSKNDVEHPPTFANIFGVIWIFSYSHLNCNKTLKINRMSLHKTFTQNVQNWLIKK